MPGLAVRRRNAIKYYDWHFDIPESRFITLYGGYEQRNVELGDLRLEFWLVPKNVAPPKVTPALPKQSYLFDDYYWKKGESGYEFDFPASPVIFADALKENPESKAYIIFYGSREKYFDVSLREARRNAVKAKQFLVNSAKIKPSRIVLLSGGYDKKWAHIELWLVPSGSDPPKPTIQK